MPFIKFWQKLHDKKPFDENKDVSVVLSNNTENPGSSILYSMLSLCETAKTYALRICLDSIFPFYFFVIFNFMSKTTLSLFYILSTLCTCIFTTDNPCYRSISPFKTRILIKITPAQPTSPTHFFIILALNSN
jgi:hypothetical protein